MPTESRLRPVPAEHEAHLYSQEPSRAGLLVTDELKKAITRCRNKVDELAAECRSRNRKFRDLEFDLGKDLEQCLHSLSTSPAEKFKPADVLRVSQIFEKPQFTVDGADSSDIVQGTLGDCWFLCAVATLSSLPGLIDKICVAKDEKVGIYGFIFCRDGEWVDVIIDDQLCTSVPKYETLSSESQNLYHKEKDLYEKVARRGSKTLYFAKSSQENETWVPLIEKAFAKLHGDYAALNGGFAFQALEDLTGGVSQVLFTNDILDTDEFWHNDLMRATKDRLFGCYLDSLAGKGAATDNTTTNGLFSSHAYSILKATEYNGKRFLKLRNPWGKSEWTGRWSDGSKEWTKQWLGALDALDHQFGDDGAFIMEYEDFLRTWYAVERTQLFDDSWVMSSHWLNVTARAFPAAWQYGDVSFTFSIEQDTSSIIVLSQADERYWDELSGYSLWTFDFVLYKKGEEKVIGRSEYSILWTRTVNLFTDNLEAGDYVLHVRLDRNVHRTKDFIPQNQPNWDARKLSRVWSEAARSMSMAANFDQRAWREQIVVPPEAFAGKDLMELEKITFEEAALERQTLREKFFPQPSVRRDSVDTSSSSPKSPTSPDQQQVLSNAIGINTGTHQKNGIVEKEEKEEAPAEESVPQTVSVLTTTSTTSTTTITTITATTAAVGQGGEEVEKKVESVDTNDEKKADTVDEEKTGTTDEGKEEEKEKTVPPTSDETTKEKENGSTLTNDIPDAITVPGPTEATLDIPISIEPATPVMETADKGLEPVSVPELPSASESESESASIKVNGPEEVVIDTREERLTVRGEIIKTPTIAHMVDPSRPDVHVGFSCDSCDIHPIVGVRWKCLVCNMYDLCTDCRSAGCATKDHSIRHRMLRIETRDSVLMSHDRITCDGCRIDPITGVRWKCLVCDDYDLCDACHSSGAHPSEHAMLRIEHPADAEDLRETVIPGEDNTLLLGLRVYTKRHVKVNISGQLRHGKIISWKKK